MAWKGPFLVYEDLRRRIFLSVIRTKEMEHREQSMLVGGSAICTRLYSRQSEEEKAQSLAASPCQIQEDIALVNLLKACVKQKDLHRGSTLYTDILKEGLLKRNIIVGNTLINMFSKCGSLAKAQEVFDELPLRDVVSWTALVSAYTQHGHAKEAINCFEQMRHEGLSPDAITFASILKACGSIGEVERGQVIHAEIVSQGLLEDDIVLGNALVDMYAKCGALVKAHQVFDELPFHDVVSCNSLITGYYQHGHGQKAINCFEQMKLDGITPDAVTFAVVLQACGSIGAAAKGEEVHAEAVREKLPMNGTDLGNVLVDMYAKCGTLGKALQVFDELPARNVVSWSALLAGYCQHGHEQEAFDLFERMSAEGPTPDVVIFACILQACSNIGAADKGKEIHAEIIKEGLLNSSTVLGSALVDMYAKCGAIARAQQVFDEIRSRNVVSWNALIAGYCQHGHGEEALNCLKSMQGEGLCPDEVTLACILKACGSIGAERKGEELHVEILRKGLLEDSNVLGNALVDMYAKCGALLRAREVFDEMPLRNLISWNALITGYCQHGLGEEALNFYERLKHKGLCPDIVTFACALKACGSIGAAARGHEIHAEIARKQLLGNSTMLGNALVDMYGKCGVLTRAQQVFDQLFVRDVVSWNALIAGYCEHGYGSEALGCFEQMKHDGICPDIVTFTSILKACGSMGAADKGELYFDMMSSKYGIIPSLEHHTCMVDLFSRAGHLDKAMAVFKKMPSFDYFPAWCAVLSACRKWENVELAEFAFKHAARLEEKSAVSYVLMSEIYSAAGRQEDADNIEALRLRNRAWKWSGPCRGTKAVGGVFFPEELD